MENRTEITEDELIDMYNDFLGDIEIFGTKYEISRVLKLVDEIAYYEGLRDFYDSIRDTFIYQGFE